MAKVSQFDRPTIRLLRDKLEAAVKSVADEYGIAINFGSARFTDANVSFKTELAVIGESGAVRQIVTDFKRYAPLWGLNAEDLGRSFVSRGTMFRIVGAKPSSRKYPILAENIEGKVYKFSTDQVLLALTLQAA